MISAAAATRPTSSEAPPSALPCSSSDSQKPVDSAGAVSENLTWTIFLLRERRNKLAGIVIAFLLILVWAISVFHNIIIAIAGCTVAAGAIKEYIAPLKFSLDSEQVTVRCAGITWIEMPWEQVRCVYRTPAGLKLSPYADPKAHRFEDLRGVTLRFPREMAARVEEFVDCRIADAAAAGASK